MFLDLVQQKTVLNHKMVVFPFAEIYICFVPVWTLVNLFDCNMTRDSIL